MALPAAAESIRLEKMGGVYHVPVELNGTMTLSFILDTGAAEVTVPADVVMTLMRAGTIQDGDFLPGKTYSLADGSQVKSPRVVLKSVKVGNQVLKNVTATIGDVEGHLLLGQSFLEKLDSWSFDPKRQLLVFGSKPSDDGSLQEFAAEAAPLNLSGKTPEATVETFFRSVAERRYDQSWGVLTPYSQDKIVKMVATEEGQPVADSEIRKLFEGNHTVVQIGFWQSFRDTSKIPSIFPVATYQLTKSKKGSAQVQVQVGEESLDFKVYEAEQGWKFGLIETLESQKKLR